MDEENKLVYGEEDDRHELLWIEENRWSQSVRKMIGIAFYLEGKINIIGLGGRQWV